MVVQSLSSEQAMKSQILHTVLCNIAGEAAGEFLDWSLLGVKGLINLLEFREG